MFSVIVPTYGRPDDLRRCVRAVLAGSRLPDELIVVVRDADHETQAAVAELLDEMNGHLIRVTQVTTAGQVAAINRGLEAATGDVVCMIDDDTAPTPGWLARLALGYDDPRVVGVGGPDRIPDSPDTEPAGRVGAITWYGRVIGNHHRGCASTQRVQHLKGANMSFRRRALPAFDPNLFRAASMLNDTDASLSAGKHGILLYDPEAAVDHFPAERGAGVSRDITDPSVVEADSHNWVYCLLKHLAWWQRPVFVAYALLVGSGARIGLLKWVHGLLTRQPRITRQFVAATRGKVRGLRTYLGRDRASRTAPGTEGPHAG